MLRHVRRHGQDCDSFGKDRDCPSRSKKKCPFWVEGRHAGTRWHQSLRTNDERTAIRLVNRIIETGRLEFEEPRTAGVTVRQAIEGFLAEQASRGMADSTLKSFRKFLIGSPNRAKCRNPEKFSPTLMEFAIDQAIETLPAFVVKPDLVAKFRQRWRVSQTTSLKQTERLKSFFKFAVDMKWITENPARTLRPPVDNDEPPVVPFTKTQVAAILKSCGDDQYLRTFLLLMRYSGLATVDAVKLTPDRLEPTNHLRLYRTKTRTWVKVLLPTVVADRLRSLPAQRVGSGFGTAKPIPSTRQPPETSGDSFAGYSVPRGPISPCGTKRASRFSTGSVTRSMAIRIRCGTLSYWSRSMRVHHLSASLNY
jgi:integrase